MNSSDAPNNSGTPRAVIAAIVLVGLSLALAIARSVEMGGWAQPLMKSVFLLAIAGIALLWVLGLYRRKNWLRWLTVISGVSGLFAIPRLLGTAGSDFQSTVFIAQCILTASASALLVLPSTSKWFASVGQT